MHFAYCVV